MYIRVENNLPCGSPQTLTDMRDGWVPFIKSSQVVDLISQTVTYVYDAENNQVVETISDIPNLNAAILASMRGTRDKMLSSCDWTQSQDSPLSDAKEAEWAAYRQALRDVPANNSDVTDPSNIIWPTKPE
tara:strand:- start:854 stop:1243 length:390 start_codon:yes stop_codon:yes gene_type:complete